jgi:putative flippase GtrA
MVALTAGLVNYATLLIFYYALDLMDIIANTLGIIAATMVNFLLNSYWTWKTSSDI